ncbi:MAG TPA: ATP-binding cassette domain-containing protein, partial [Steroidobacteraceae bacterium]|nr:ATP-binding cassette domain-containing protein [Steroidobacteraceae bacterium]
MPEPLAPSLPPGPWSSRPIVDVRGFTKRYRKRTAIDLVDLALERGELHGLIGPDGSGKSTLMKAIAGVLTFDAGSVTVCATSLASERAAESVKDRIGFMPQGLGHHLYPNLSVEENIDFFARLRLLPELEISRRKEKLLAITRLARFRQRTVKLLSGGMKQKLGLICTLIHEPEVLILDEPTTGVDPVSRRDFWEIVGELLRERGLTALISTAYLDEASRFDRVTLLHGGRVIARGAPDRITSQLAGTVVSLEAADPAAALRTLKRVFPQTDFAGSRLQVFIPEPDTETAVRKVAAALPDADVRTMEASAPQLEDAFCALLQRVAPTGPYWMPGADEEGPAVLRKRDGAAIEAAGLTKIFGRFTAVQDATFAVPPGEIFGLLGANGAGKTTVIKMLTGIIEPTRGTGRVAGADMRAAPQAVKEHIGYMSQSFSLYSELSVLENIRLYAGVYGLDGRTAQKRTDWVLTMAGLRVHERDRAESLPIGMRQRLALG